MNFQIIIAALIAALIAATGFGSAWTIQNWRADAKEKDYVEQTLANERLSAAQALRQSQAVLDAQSAATVRAIALRRDADGSRAALVGLSQSADAALRDAATSFNACTIRATAFSELFIASTNEYSELAEKAGRHVNDIETLTASWAK